MLRKIKSKIMSLFDKHFWLKILYYKFAVFCSNHRITPPLSSRSKRSEEIWAGQTKDGDKSPLHYVEMVDGIKLMFLDIIEHLNKNANILEIGCNAGASIDYLYQQGYRNFTGIEIGLEAKRVMQEYFPDAFNTTEYIVGNACDELKKLPANYYDLVFAKATLVNIAPKWNEMFKEMARVSRGYILTFEREGTITAYPRSFEKMLKKVGYKQIVYKHYNLTPDRKNKTLSPKYLKDEMFNTDILRIFAKEN